jgi:hypothetical protein
VLTVSTFAAVAVVTTCLCDHVKPVHQVLQLLYCNSSCDKRSQRERATRTDDQAHMLTCTVYISSAKVASQSPALYREHCVQQQDLTSATYALRVCILCMYQLSFNS